MTDIEVFPTDETFTQWTHTVPMIKDIFDLIPRTAVYAYLDGLSRQRCWWRTNIRSPKTVHSEVFNINFGVKKLKPLRVIEDHRVGTAQILNGPTKAGLSFLQGRLKLICFVESKTESPTLKE
jgi:hypothetical protein